MLLVLMLVILCHGEGITKTSTILNKPIPEISRSQNEDTNCRLQSELEWMVKMNLSNNSIRMLEIQSNHSWILVTINNMIKIKSYNFICMTRSNPFDVKKTNLASNKKNSTLQLRRVRRYRNTIKCRFLLLHQNSSLGPPPRLRIGISTRRNKTGQSDLHWYMHTSWFPLAPCVVRNLSVSMPKKKPISYTNRQMESIEVRPLPSKVIREGSQLNLSCTGNSTHHNVIWYKGSKRLFGMNDVLRFSLVNRTISGVYRCSRHLANRTIQSMPYYLRVTHMDTPMISTSTLASNESIHLILFKCHGSAYPRATYSWTKDGKFISHASEIIVQHSQLHSSGMYRCHLRNKYLRKVSKALMFPSFYKAISLKLDTYLRNYTKRKEKDRSSLENAVLFKSSGLGLRNSTVSSKGALVLMIVLIVEFLGLAAFIPLLVVIHKTDLIKERGDVYEPLNDTEDELSKTTDLQSKLPENEIDIFYVMRSKNVSLPQIV